MSFYIDVETSTGTKVGSGPITHALSWTSTARMDKAGEFSFSIAATDPKAASIVATYVVRCYAKLAAGWTEIGGGIINKIEKTVGEDGITILVVSGPDLIHELSYRSVGRLAPVAQAPSWGGIFGNSEDKVTGGFAS